MISYDRPIDEIIEERYSCRRYLRRPLSTDDAGRLSDDAASIETGPLGSRMRFALAAAREQDRSILNGLGTYGQIKNPTGFLIGVSGQEARALEDFGYAMELLVLRAADLGLGTCWVGGVFTRSSFAKKIGALEGESVPAIIATGYPDPEDVARDKIRKLAGSNTRFGWETLFFDGTGNPLSRETAGGYAGPLEMLRLGPSASNKQPWRVVREGQDFHFYLERSPGYGRATLSLRLVGLADIQRLDLGIAMCHFDLSARAHGLSGAWIEQDPPSLPAVQPTWEYTVSWKGVS